MWRELRAQLFSGSGALPDATGSRAYFALLFIGILMAILLVTAAGLYFADTAARETLAAELRNRERIAVQSMAGGIRGTLIGVTEDLLFLRQRAAEQVAEQQPIDILAAEWVAFGNSHRSYLQLRYLDAQGREVLRINQTDDGARRTPDSALQDKRSTSYVSSALRLAPEQILVTRLDANRERGRIEVPVRPVIRLVAQVRDPGGRLVGLVVINYRADLLLNTVMAVASPAVGEPFLASERGRSALEDFASATPESIALDKALQNRFAQKLPGAWAAMQALESGVVDDGLGGWVTFARFTVAKTLPPEGFDQATRWRVPSDMDGSGPLAGWFIGLHIDAATLEEALALDENRARPALAMFLLLSTLLAWLLTQRFTRLNRTAAQLHEVATRDDLTGLYNRREFEFSLEAAIARAERNNRPMAVLYLDLNGFKAINDTLGHAAGDALLKHVADMFRANIRRSDLAARLGGDEFAVILGELSAREDVLRVAQTLTQQLATPLLIAGQSITPQASMGSAIYPEDGTTVSELLDHADRAMYDDKASYKRSAARSGALP